MLILMLMASDNQKGHTASHVDHLDLRSGMGPLMTLLAVCEMPLALWYYVTRKGMLHMVSVVLT